MNPFLILGLAIGAEVTATLALKAADGLTKPGPTLIVAVGYGTALWLMSSSMDMLPIGIVYAIWSGVGMIGAALGGVLGNVVDGGRQRTLGTLLGGAGGALLGRSIEQQQVRCQ